MSFRLTTLLYLFALTAAPLAVFGAWGVLVSGMVYVAAVTRFRQPLVRLVVAMVVVVIGLPYVLPASLAVRLPAPQTDMAPQLRRVAIAVHQYHDTHGQFPPSQVTDAEGNALYSWRVAILPYLEGAEQLSELYHYDEPWNSPHNQALIDRGEKLFSSQAHSVSSSEYPILVVAPQGPNTIWRPNQRTRFVDVTDGTVNTIMLLVIEGSDIIWSEPRDIDAATAVDLLMGDDSHHVHFIKHHYLASVTYVVTGSELATTDGAAYLAAPIPNHATASNLLTMNDVELIEDPWRDRLSYSSAQRVAIAIHWPRIWGVAVWLALALLPLHPAAHRRIWPPKTDATEPSEGPEAGEH